MSALFLGYVRSNDQRPAEIVGQIILPEPSRNLDTAGKAMFSHLQMVQQKMVPIAMPGC